MKLKQSKHRNEIVIALIGLVGIVLTNLDKLGFGDTGGYKPTNNLDVELGYYLELTGARESLELMKANLEEKYRKKYGLTPEQIACVIDNSFFVDDYYDAVFEAHKKYLTLEDVQQLNGIASTEPMQRYRERNPAILRDLMERLDRVADTSVSRFRSRQTSPSGQQTCEQGDQVLPRRAGAAPAPSAK